eukprot:TRINITY_DN19117_c0_g1_i2.p1 TRINITY_DN19117_c0_g1~~TRINITY_DN19117_c0_g1_i2.p1  ORF type:complete len:202 (+),score=47.01 TRINITY_DN19117_c0_g1_i2:59-607(+)
MGCTGSNESKPTPAAPPTRGGEYQDPATTQVSKPQRQQWENGEDFPSTMTYMQVQKPDRPLKGIVLVDCLIDNARDSSLVDCTLRGCILNNCHLRNCTVEDGCTVTRCVVKGGSVKESTLTSGTEVSDGTMIDRSIITDRCSVTACKIGPTITTTGSVFYSCTGNPQPPPQSSECHDCEWSS